MNRKTVVVLPGSFWQIPLLKRCKEKGYRTLVINPYDDSPGFSYADGYLKSDIFDFEKVVEYCRSQKADAVVSDECDIAMPLLAKVAKTLSLPALDEKSAHLFTDKYAMREFCLKHGIPSPEYKLCKTIEEAENFFEQLNTKVIIKPLDSNSSRGVYTIRHKSEIKEYFYKTLAFSKIKKAVLLERFIEGIEFTVDGIKTPDRHYSLAISEKKHFSHNPNVACELYFKNSSTTYNYELLSAQNDLFVNSSTLQFGLTHAEYKYENGKFYLIEIAARGGGNLISSHIVPYISGIDNYEYLLECCLGNIVSPDFTPSSKVKNRCAVLKFFEAPEEKGIVEKIEGIDFLKNCKQIVAYQFKIKEGDVIIAADTDADRAGFYIACCESEAELKELIKVVDKKVRIIYKTR